MTPDPYATLRDAALRSVLDGPGETDPALRRAAFEGADDLPGAVRPLVAKVHAHAYKVIDADVAAARDTLGDDDRAFETIVSAALGAAHQRLSAGLRALEEA